MSHELTAEQQKVIEAVKDELNQISPESFGAVGIGLPIPPFVMALLKSVGYTKGAAFCVQGILDKHPAGWGKELPVSHEEKITTCNSRGAVGDVIWRKVSDK